MKVKIFRQLNEISMLEININEWIAQENIHIVKTESSSTSVGPAEDQWSVLTIVIWYEP